MTQFNPISTGGEGGEGAEGNNVPQGYIFVDNS